MVDDNQFRIKDLSKCTLPIRVGFYLFKDVSRVPKNPAYKINMCEYY